MHFARENISSEFMVSSYREGEIRVAGQTYSRSIILAPDRLIDDWRPQTHLQLESADFEPIHALGPEILLLGTGTRLHFPPAPLTGSLLQAGIGVEVMDTAAACRTFNILLSEGRPVVAALLLA
jgi:uncharacterized protein